MNLFYTFKMRKIPFLFASCIFVLLFVQFMLISEVRYYASKQVTPQHFSTYPFITSINSFERLEQILADYPKNIPQYEDVLLGKPKSVLLYGPEDDQCEEIDMYSFYGTPAEGRFEESEEIPKSGEIVFLSNDFNRLPFDEGDTVLLTVDGVEDYFTLCRADVDMELNNRYSPYICVVTTDLFQSTNSPIGFVSFQYKKELSSVEEKRLLSYLSSGLDTIEKQEADSDSTVKTISTYLEIITLFIMMPCVFSLLGIVRFMYLSKQREYAIFRICGAKRRQIAGAFLRRILLYWSASVAAASLLFFLCNYFSDYMGDQVMGPLFYVSNIGIQLAAILFMWSLVLIEQRMRDGGRIRVDKEFA